MDVKKIVWLITELTGSINKGVYQNDKIKLVHKIDSNYGFPKHQFKVYKKSAFLGLWIKVFHITAQKKYFTNDFDFEVKKHIDGDWKKDLDKVCEQNGRMTK